MSILKREPGMRNKKDIEILGKCMQSVFFFQSHDKTTIERCMKFMTYKKLAKDEVVFEVGNLNF
jgi:hypothetical protein